MKPYESCKYAEENIYETENFAMKFASKITRNI